MMWGNNTQHGHRATVHSSSDLGPGAREREKQKAARDKQQKQDRKDKHATRSADGISTTLKERDRDRDRDRERGGGGGGDRERERDRDREYRDRDRDRERGERERDRDRDRDRERGGGDREREREGEGTYGSLGGSGSSGTTARIKTPKALRKDRTKVTPRDSKASASSSSQHHHHHHLHAPSFKDTISHTLWAQVFAFLDARSLCRVGETCKEWYHLSNDDELWTHLSFMFVMRGGDLFACDGYSKRQFDIDRAMARRSEVSSHKEMMRRRFDTISYYNAELSTQWNKRKKQPEAKTLILGLNDAGKTTIMYLLQMGQVVQTIPTVGNSIEQLVVDGITLNLWDVGGKKQLRGLWSVYAGDGLTDLLVWVVDIHDKDRLEKAKRNLRKFVERQIESPSGNLSELRAMLVIANKATKRKWDAKRVAAKIGLTELRAFNDPRMRREWLILPSWRMKDVNAGDDDDDVDSETGLRKKSEEARLSEKNLWKGVRWLVHTGFIVPGNAAASSSAAGGVMSFLSTLAG